MFDTTVDTLYVWVALSAVSLAVLGIVLGLPTGAPPDAAETATTIDEVATSPPGSVATRDIDAAEWTLTNRRVGLRADGGTAHQTLLRPVVPVVDGPLVSVLRGTDPAAAFESPAAFERAVETARTTDTRWRPAPERITVRRVAWGGVDVTLVG
jgi:hypothetical protein